MKPPLTYYGGKQKLAQHIIPHIPKHTLYCEPFSGGAAVFYVKEPSEIEVLNDINGELINFYQVVKKDFKALQKEIKLTLHSRNQHYQATVINTHPSIFTKLQRAWAIWVLANQSYASKLNGQWGYDRTENKSAKQNHYKKQSFTIEIANRLEQTQIECTDALEVIKSRDKPSSFFFCDPPYFNSHQGHYKGYTVKDYENLLKVLSEIKGKFLLCSYPSTLLTRYTKTHNWYTKKVNSSLSLSSHPTALKKRKIEHFTTNYPL